MIDGEGYTGGGRNFSRIRDFLKIGLDCNGKGKKGVINHIQSGRQIGGSDIGIGDENTNQPDIFNCQRPLFSDNPDEFADAFARACASTSGAILELMIDPDGISPRATITGLRARKKA